jgi:hypothetical protein
MILSSLVGTWEWKNTSLNLDDLKLLFIAIWLSEQKKIFNSTHILVAGISWAALDSPVVHCARTISKQHFSAPELTVLKSYR